jgi:peptidoglycan hydrolase-like protein with peptidoglycan-binding domain
MHRLLVGALAVLLSLASVAAAQNSNTNTATPAPNANAAPAQKRKPPFRATKDQIMQAQTLLKQRGFYAGEMDGKLNPDTRAGLKKYQETEGLKVTGTLNAGTLQKMSIPLTDRQKEWLKTTM